MAGGSVSGGALPLPQVDVLGAKKNDLSARVADVKTREQAQAVAHKFESMFVSEMLAPMFAGLETDGPFGGGSAEAAFRPMLIEKYADALTKRGGIGISDSVLKEILRLQGLS